MGLRRGIICACAAALAIWACDSTEVTSAPPDGGVGASGETNEAGAPRAPGATGGDDGDDRSTGANGDGDDDQGSVDAGDAGRTKITSTPGLVACGSAYCTLPQICCVRGAWTNAKCVDADECQGYDVPIACDEKADCTGKNVCCRTAGLATLNDASVVRSEYTCQSSCAGQSSQQCGTDSECDSGKCWTGDCALGMWKMGYCGKTPAGSGCDFY
jgi:hypothetical protein